MHVPSLLRLPQLLTAIFWESGGGGGDGVIFLACGGFGRMFDYSFPACAFFLFFSAVAIRSHTLMPLSEREREGERERGRERGREREREGEREGERKGAVSYTHLTLPTS